jgi:hypothetical protein
MSFGTSVTLEDWHEDLIKSLPEGFSKFCRDSLTKFASNNLENLTKQFNEEKELYDKKESELTEGKEEQGKRRALLKELKGKIDSLNIKESKIKELNISQAEYDFLKKLNPNNWKPSDLQSYKDNFNRDIKVEEFAKLIREIEVIEKIDFNLKEKIEVIKSDKGESENE